jgi:hypothetical protein
MELSKIIEGLTILYDFYDEDDCHLSTDDGNEIYMSVTDRPLDEESVAKMVELGWHQEYEGLDYSTDFTAEDYDANEEWIAYV